MKVFCSKVRLLRRVVENKSGSTFSNVFKDVSLVASESPWLEGFSGECVVQPPLPQSLSAFNHMERVQNNVSAKLWLSL